MQLRKTLAGLAFAFMAATAAGPAGADETVSIDGRVVGLAAGFR